MEPLEVIRAWLLLEGFSLLVMVLWFILSFITLEITALTRMPKLRKCLRVLHYSKWLYHCGFYNARLFFHSLEARWRFQAYSPAFISRSFQYFSCLSGRLLNFSLIACSLLTLCFVFIVVEVDLFPLEKLRTNQEGLKCLRPCNHPLYNFFIIIV